MPPAPPPPPTPAGPPRAAADADPEAAFVIEGATGDERVSFPQRAKAEPGTVALSAVVRHFLGAGPLKLVTRDELFNVLGRLQSLSFSIREYNAGLKDPSAPWFSLYIRRRTLDQLSAFGFQIESASRPLSVPGLDELIAAAEGLFAEDNAAYRALIAGGKITFEALGELYVPGTAVAGATGLGGVQAGFFVVESYYDVKRTLMGFEKGFHLVLEFVVAVGAEHFAVVRFEEVLSGWQGVRARPLGDLAYVPMNEADQARFEERGLAYSRYGIGGPAFVQYDSGTFFIHGGAKKQGGLAASGSGRLMLDTARGIQLGHYPSQAADEASNALIQTAGRYRRWIADQRSKSGGTAPDSLFIMRELPKQLLKFTWPALTGFSFSSKAWGHVLVEGLREIRFNEKAFDQLVLPADHKRLIRALVTFGADSFEDIIEGKSGGSIFLLHGPPGVGKTLTAEAISEVLKRPLYYVSMGELGITPEEMEKRLGEVLDLCAEWDALVLIDEADVFLEKRSTSDVLRNAMVCVMLRLLEYHRGILFLTTNRVREFDPAFESRVTLALRYFHLDPKAREQVWRNLVARAGIEVGTLDFGQLAQHTLNGRQIKNALRLAIALAKDAGSPLEQEQLDQSIGITSLSKQEMANAEEFGQWERSGA
ncbi:P-loop containing nucleoside triphosphate hydrolase protein [Hyaloraphidium curvatum]|nr:P-loop containing nucleoside triphosphate hydrolase protein [Hyaloraphidium curvatum]